MARDSGRKFSSSWWSCRKASDRPYPACPEFIEGLKDKPWRRTRRVVSARAYNQRRLGPSLVEFLAERRTLLRWLKGLGTPDWEAKVVMRFGTLRDGGMFAAWAAHASSPCANWSSSTGSRWLSTRSRIQSDTRACGRGSIPSPATAKEPKDR